MCDIDTGRCWAPPAARSCDRAMTKMMTALVWPAAGRRGAAVRSPRGTPLPRARGVGRSRAAGIRVGTGSTRLRRRATKQRSRCKRAAGTCPVVNAMNGAPRDGAVWLAHTYPHGFETAAPLVPAPWPRGRAVCGCRGSHESCDGARRAPFRPRGQAYSTTPTRCCARAIAHPGLRRIHGRAGRCLVATARRGRSRSAWLLHARDTAGQARSADRGSRPSAARRGQRSESSRALDLPRPPREQAEAHAADLAPRHLGAGRGARPTPPRRRDVGKLDADVATHERKGAHRQHVLSGSSRSGSAPRGRTRLVSRRFLEEVLERDQPEHVPVSSATRRRLAQLAQALEQLVDHIDSGTRASGRARSCSETSSPA